MELSDILAKRSIIACAKVTSKRQLLQICADEAAAISGIDAHSVFETLVEREKLGSTGLGNGIAIPHGKIDDLSGVIAVYVRLEAPIDFDAVDDQPIDLAVMLLAPNGAGADHLKALSRVARLMRTESVLAELRNTRDAAEIYKILTRSLQDSVAA